VEWGCGRGLCCFGVRAGRSCVARREGRSPVHGVVMMWSPSLRGRARASAGRRTAGIVQVWHPSNRPSHARGVGRSLLRDFVDEVSPLRIGRPEPEPSRPRVIEPCLFSLLPFHLMVLGRMHCAVRLIAKGLRPTHFTVWASPTPDARGSATRRVPSAAMSHSRIFDEPWEPLDLISLSTQGYQTTRDYARQPRRCNRLVQTSVVLSDRRRRVTIRHRVWATLALA